MCLNRWHHRPVRYARFFKMKALFAVVIIYDPVSTDTHTHTHRPHCEKHSRGNRIKGAVVELLSEVSQAREKQRQFHKRSCKGHNSAESKMTR